MGDSSMHAKEQPADIEASAALNGPERKVEDREATATSIDVTPVPVLKAPAKALPPWRRRWNTVYAFMDSNHLVIALIACE